MKILIVLTLFINSAYGDVTLDQLLDKIDNVYRSKSSSSTMIMKIKTPHWERVLEMKVWTKGMEKTFITIISPKKEKGVSTLKKNNEMWNYFPKVNKVIKVPASMMMGSWMGSDFTNDDLVKEHTYRHDFTHKILKKSKSSYTIELLPKKSTVTVWGKIQLVVDALKFIPIKQDFYNEKGTLIRSIMFSKIQKINQTYVPLIMTLKSHNKPGNETTIEYKDLKLDVGVSDGVFRMNNLKKRR
ncbi:MAG: outer membrane lipoprotein-sorting protein [Halobacteriovoraceae bacterium]|nr:outer membrane lipoprotein-sorting protein [Halobacteriovoraceae bacterium]